MKIITRVSHSIRPEWWQGSCYFDHCALEVVMAPFGLHLVIRAWWWFCLRFWKWQFGPCYLDRRIEELMGVCEENSKLKRQLQWVNYENTILRSEVLNLRKNTNQNV